jgi:hypothetical protein
MRRITFLSTLFITTLSLAMTTLPAEAQERRMPPAVLGIGVGYDYGTAYSLNSNESDFYNNRFSNFAEVKAANMTLIFPKLFAQGCGISTTFSYAKYHLNATGTDDRQLTDINGDPTDGVVSVAYDLNTDAVMMDLLAYIQVGDIARIELGPWMGFGYFPRSEESDLVLSPSTALFSDGSNYRSETVSDRNQFLANFGGELRVSLEIPFIAGMALVPSGSLKASYVIPSNSNHFGIVGTTGLGLGLLFGQPNGEEIPPPPPTSSIDTVVRVDTVSVVPLQTIRPTVDLYSRDQSGRRTDTLLLSPTQTLHHIEVPVMTTLQFEQNSASLPAHYTGLTASTRGDFSLDALIGTSPLELHRQRLNVIGLRLHNDPTTLLTITGSSDSDEPKWFAEARAKAVKKYLTETWDIDAKRITIKSAKDAGGTEVKLASASSGLFAPMVAEWIDQEINAAPIGVEPQFASAGGVRSWRIAVTQNGKEIGVVRNNDAPGSGSINASMIVHDASSSAQLPALNAELVVEDSSGRVEIAHDQMIVIVPEHPGVTDSTAQSVSTFALLDSTQAALDVSIARIAAAAANGAEIVIGPAVSGSIDSERLNYISSRLQSELAAHGKNVATVRIDRNLSDGGAQVDETTALAVLVAVTEQR